jgi:spore coat assembly protein
LSSNPPDIPKHYPPAYYVAYKNSGVVLSVSDFKIGDIVKRKSYGGDVYFKIADITWNNERKPVFLLRGLLYRLQADCHDQNDLVRINSREVDLSLKREFTKAKQQAHQSGQNLQRFLRNRIVSRPGVVVHIDSSEEFLDKCLDFYTKSGIRSASKLTSEESQPQYVKYMLGKYKPDILVITGHDALKKNNSSLYTMDNYRSSKYFVESVREARRVEPSYDKLCIFAGACQSYYEAIMDAGANFASSPGRVFINALDPAFVAEKVALTDSSNIVTPSEIADITISGRQGVWGIDTKGHLN